MVAVVRQPQAPSRRRPAAAEEPPMSMLIQNPTRILFFTGKGGVGKTSAACATAIALADSGKRALLVSTDPASNLDEVLGVALSCTPTEVPTVLRGARRRPPQAGQVRISCSGWDIGGKIKSV